MKIAPSITFFLIFLLLPISISAYYYELPPSYYLSKTSPAPLILLMGSDDFNTSQTHMQFNYENLRGQTVFPLNLSRISQEGLERNMSLRFTVYSDQPIFWEIKSSNRSLLESNSSVTDAELFMLKPWLEYFAEFEETRPIHQPYELSLIARSNNSAAGSIVFELVEDVDTLEHFEDFLTQTIPIRQYFLQLVFHELAMDTVFKTAYKNTSFWIEACATLRKPDEVTARFTKCNATTGHYQIKANISHVMDREIVGDAYRTMHLVCRENMVEKISEFSLFDDERIVGNMTFTLRSKHPIGQSLYYEHLYFGTILMILFLAALSSCIIPYCIKRQQRKRAKKIRRRRYAERMFSPVKRRAADDFAEYGFLRDPIFFQ